MAEAAVTVDKWGFVGSRQKASSRPEPTALDIVVGIGAAEAAAEAEGCGATGASYGAAEVVDGGTGEAAGGVGVTCAAAAVGESDAPTADRAQWSTREQLKGDQGKIGPPASFLE